MRAATLLLTFALLPLWPWPDLVRSDETAPGTEKATPAAPLIAIGDIHGDFDTFLALLHSIGVVDMGGHWSAGSTHVVQTGDMLDRGAESRLVMELLMRLEKESAAAGGRLTVLLGNHEIMNLTGDLGFVSAGEIAAFRADESPALRAAERKRILGWLESEQPALRSGYRTSLLAQLREVSFDRYFAPGYFAHREAFSPSGRYGRWLLAKDGILVERSTIFVHAGLRGRFGRAPAARVNRSIREHLLAYFRIAASLEERGLFCASLGSTELFRMLRAEAAAGGLHPELRSDASALTTLLDGPIFADDGPFWTRALALDDERPLESDLLATLRSQNAQRMVIGHTQPSSLRVETRFSGRVVLIDTGMNQRAYGGKPSALWLSPDGDQLRVLD